MSPQGQDRPGTVLPGGARAATPVAIAPGRDCEGEEPTANSQSPGATVGVRVAMADAGPRVRRLPESTAIGGEWKACVAWCEPGTDHASVSSPRDTCPRPARSTEAPTARTITTARAARVKCPTRAALTIARTLESPREQMLNPSDATARSAGSRGPTDPMCPRERTLHMARNRSLGQSGQMSPAALEDAALLARVSAGNEAAIELLYQRYGGTCFALARRILDDTQLAEDVVQQVFLAIWQGTGYDARRGAVSTWLLSVTHHKAVDSVRREGTRRKRLANEQTLLEVAAAGPGPEDEAWSRLRAARTRDALRVLPAEQREVLLLAYYGGYTQREIAEMTGLPLGTVKSRTLTALRRLRADLGSAAETAPDEGRTE
jgi:RNA polymerase sigma factor (sigma-70 family)